MTAQKTILDSLKRVVEELEDMANGLYAAGAMTAEKRLEVQKDLKEIREKNRRVEENLSGDNNVK